MLKELNLTVLAEEDVVGCLHDLAYVKPSSVFRSFLSCLTLFILLAEEFTFASVGQYLLTVQQVFIVQQLLPLLNELLIGGILVAV